MHPQCWDDIEGRRRPLFLWGLPLYLKREMDGRVEEKKARDRKRVRVWGRPMTHTDPQTPATTRAFV